jgi:membrane-bound lytic murein transglycosylase B
VADARLEARVIGLDFSFVVLDAYVKAAAGIALFHPSCGLRWQALAGIGRTESQHGTYGGAVVGPDGNVSKPIIGIPLDGENGTVGILDTDGGALDGDTVHDRAVGPMQFIPSTWRALGLDGNGDGRADPQNVYDAALSAANLLCRVGPLDDDGLRRALLRYNNSTAYVDVVLDRSRGYDAFVFPQ